MNHGHTVESLIRFRDRVADAFKAKQVRSPVHFPSDTQAEPLLRIFEGVKPYDWCCSNWRSMFHALLKGIPEDELFEQILAGRSMYIHSKEHRFLSSSIVGGMLPTAVGLAMGLKRKGPVTVVDPNEPAGTYPIRIATVWVFVGDMTSRTGLFHEATQYAIGHNLPMRFIVENNGYSTNARTEETWRSCGKCDVPAFVDGYNYERTMPHVGLQERVSF